MRRYIGPIVYLGITLCAGPVAAAPSVHDGEEVSARKGVQTRSFASTGLSDEAAMVLAGALLIGAAAAVRRAA